MAIAFVFTLVFVNIMDRHIADVLGTDTQRKLFECLKRRRTAYILFGILVGIVVVICWKPYTMFKTI